MPTATSANSLTLEFEGDRRDHALMMLVGVDMARAEQDGEDRHADRGQERDVGKQRRRRNAETTSPRRS